MVKAMFGKKKKAPPIYDITQKLVKTWWGGTKLVPTSKREQKKIKKEILAADPHATVMDSAAKKQMELEWIDRIEDIDAFLSD